MSCLQNTLLWQQEGIALIKNSWALIVLKFLY